MGYYRELKKEDVKSEDNLNFVAALSHTPGEIDQLLGHVETVLRKSAKEWVKATAGMEPELRHPSYKLRASLEAISKIKAELTSAFLIASAEIEEKKHRPSEAHSIAPDAAGIEPQSQPRVPERRTRGTQPPENSKR